MAMSNGNRAVRMLLLAAMSGALSGGALAHGGEAMGGTMRQGGMEKMHEQKIDYANAEEHPFGKASDPESATRSIEIGMADTMRFDPAVIEVRAGEPLRFVVINQGKLMHEMVIGTRDELEQHAAMMKKFPGMEHAEPYMAHVAPGAHGEIGWTFTQPGEYLYGCLIPGHYEGGMTGRVVVK